MRFFYNFFIILLRVGMGVGTLFNYKLKKGLAGRRQSLSRVRSVFEPTDEVLWMHAASLGEYEQGLPVLTELKKQYPHYKVLVTFFSPSGYDHVIKKHDEIIDCICYLPLDRRECITEFCNAFTPRLFFTVKYDFWYTLLGVLKSKGCKNFVISALFYESQIFFKPYGKWFVKRLQQNIDWIFHQTKHSTALAKSIGLKNSSTSGDTRFDRVKELKVRNNTVSYIDDFLNDRPCIVFGSAWQAEERIAEMIARKTEGFKIIIAPHDMKRVEVLREVFPHAIYYTEIQPNEEQRLQTAEVLIIDCIGLLSKLYSYAHVAIVGGGFHSAGLHNILEAAVFSKPVFFGNHYRKNPEADALIAAGGARSFEDEFYAAPFIIDLLNKPEKLHEMGRLAGEFIENQPKAKELILRKIVTDFS